MQLETQHVEEKVFKAVQHKSLAHKLGNILWLNTNLARKSSSKYS